ncbi:MAG: sensor histidine kinase [Actinomycetota bacterium]
MLEFVRVGIASRIFALAAVLGLAVALDNPVAAQATLLVSLVAAVGVFLSLSSTRPIHWVVAVESGVASLVVAQYLPETFVLLPYLVVLPLIGGLARGAPGALLNALFQLVASVLATLVARGSGGLAGALDQLAPWWVTMLSAGLVGAWARKVRRLPSTSEAEENYVAARRLLRQLRGLARQLSSGLDPVGIADELLATVQARLSAEVSAVFARTEGGAFAPLAYLGPGAQDVVDPNDPTLERCWSSGTVVQRHQNGDRSGPVAWAALPLRGGTGGLLGVVLVGGLAVGKRQLELVNRELDDLSLRLDTALAFDEVRSLVTADERQRLAREIHDGVAQEIASLGYVVDEIAAGAGDPRVVEDLEGLRRELSRVVSELRLSIFDLRADVGTSAGLGSALSEYARKVGRQAAITVHLTLNEAPTRLTPAVEAELFRIAQEAITNARKHSAADNLWVDCHVDPPHARVEIRDDGQGVRGKGRSASYGLKIMQERAERIGAGLTISPVDDASERPGTCVTVAVGKSRQHQPEGDLVR